MAAGPGVAGSGDALPTTLIDVTGIPLDQLLPSTDSVLANSLSALVAEMSGNREILAAFGNFAPDEPSPL
ncbi:hypothetical protein GCM10010112_09020 [Actinoplanes lobatus]|uniref:FXSXX-COOH protein n=1 Tax=Actinoplanes lobatus TaxID=113568 RepID=A0A7W7MFK6_9ACTN|nr:hypothetical protein [Actinoplanes lobatus]MBB4748366.1 hypothetical protein [Actinoplanes lobatus]GGN56826.1 hypothetical protein GCM10010112_09020 [Actinoplanes lobatus]GIE37730.1 hypothetical protein Alo02nite_06280 [Actinoplanes lobatus]